MNKQFDQDLYDKYDSVAKDVVISYFYSEGINLRPNPDRYGIDLISDNGLGVETEVKKCWVDEFPFTTVHIPYRKSKWVNGSNMFVMLSNNLDQLAIISSQDMTDVVTKDTVYTTDEKFYAIPVNKIKIIRIGNG